MEFIEEPKGLKITIDDTDRKFLQEVSKDNHNQLCTDKAEQEFFAPYFENSEYEWISSEDIGALTSAPIIGITEEDDNGDDVCIEAYGYMDYQVHSMLEELYIHGEVLLIKG